MARILVVDDEEPVRALLQRLLKVHGHAVDAAADGMQAVDLLMAHRYELLIIDRNMPRLSGVDAVSVLRTSPRFRDLKILMLTQTTLNKDVEEAFEAGVDGYVFKPFDMKALVAKIAWTLQA